MEFGIFDHLDRGGGDLAAAYDLRLRLAEIYDRSGFYCYHQAEHHSTPLGAAPSPSVFLSALAQRTRRLRFGPLVYTLPLYNPLRLAEEICMLDAMSGGRMQLGVGKGISPHELSFYGIDPAKAQAMYVEALELILKILQSPGEDLTFAGTYYKLDNVPIVVAPVQRPHPPLWYGIARPDSVAWAAAHDVNIIGNVDSPRMRPITDTYRQAWRARGLDDSTIPRMGMSRHIVLAETDAEALSIARRAYANWHQSFMFLWDRRGSRPPNAAYPDSFDELVTRGLAVAGSPSSVRDTLRRQAADAGVNYLLCRFAFGDIRRDEVEASVTMFAREIMPAFADGALRAQDAA